MNMSALMRQFSIRIRMIGAIAMVLALLCTLGGVGLFGINAMRDQSQAYIDQTAKTATDLGELSHALSDPAMQAKAADLQKQLSSAAKQSQQQESDAHDHVLTSFVAMLVLSAVIVVPLTLLNMQSICKPLAQAEDLARAIAQGDLTNASGEIEGQDEASSLLRSLQHMQGGLQTLVGQLRASADHIRTASVEIATGNQDLSNRTEQTAGNLQKAASSMVQLTGTVRQTADSALTANQLASSASSAAAKGGSVVDQVVSTMDEINVSSKRINDIIGVIDGIAFQTNILALNAAVEAARAGEQGRGFAVVAGEVRSLAQRSAGAAREIKTLIGASVERVEIGARLVRDAGTSMTEIVSSVQRVSDIIGEISAAANEQSNGIEQVNHSVVQLDQMTQQNAALVEQSAAAAESLRDQAEQLAQAVGRFRVSASATAAPGKSTASFASYQAKPKAGVKSSVASKPGASAPKIGGTAAPAASAKRLEPSIAAPKPAQVKTAVASESAADGDWETF